MIGRSWVRIPLSADSLRYKCGEGNYDTRQKCWMVLVVHGELVTRIVAIEWFDSLGALRHVANVSMRNSKA